jgi:hypothetical protein
VRVHLPWRRRDRNPEHKPVIVTTASDQPIANAAVLNLTRMAAEVVSAPVAGSDDLWMRVHPDDHLVYLSASPIGQSGTLIRTFPRSLCPDDPVALRVGKSSQLAAAVGAGATGPLGQCRIAGVTVEAACP